MDEGGGNDGGTGQNDRGDWDNGDRGTGMMRVMGNDVTVAGAGWMRVTGNDGDRGAGMIQGDLRCGGSVRTVKEGGVLWRGFS